MIWLYRTSALLLSVSFLSGCFFSDEQKNDYMIKKEIRSDNAKIMIPVDLWDVIESTYTKEESMEALAPEESRGTAPTFKVLRKTSKVETPLRFMDLKVFLKENNYGVLQEKDYEISLGKGGGIIDFANYVDPKLVGSFRIEFEMEDYMHLDEGLKVYFWGNGKARNISGEVFGTKCDQFQDVSTFFKTKILVRGLEATTHKKKYATSLSGTYVFVLEREGAVYISQLTLRDSRLGILQCHQG